MIIRIILLTLLAMIGYFAFLRRNAFPVHIVLVFLVLGGAATMVIAPELTNRLAAMVGVGRGADLITYLVEVALLFIILHYYTKFVELQSQLTALAREMALLRAEIERLAAGR